MNYFVFIGSGEKFEKKARISADILKRYTKQAILIINVDLPNYTNLQTAKLIKTSVHNYVPMSPDNFFCYLDSDAVAVSNNVDSVFDCPPCTFIPDWVNTHRFIKHCFKPDGKNFDVKKQRIDGFSKLQQMFNIHIPKDYTHGNTGVFTFDMTSIDFLNHWHENTKQIVEDRECPNWDQLALLVTTIQRQEHNRNTLPYIYNWMTGGHKPRTLKQAQESKPIFIHFTGNTFNNPKNELWKGLVL